jgi:hypothetical protein
VDAERVDHEARQPGFNGCLAKIRFRKMESEEEWIEANSRETGAG